VRPAGRRQLGDRAGAVPEQVRDAEPRDRAHGQRHDVVGEPLEPGDRLLE
jgi:hypothetical protein